MRIQDSLQSLKNPAFYLALSLQFLVMLAGAMIPGGALATALMAPTLLFALRLPGSFSLWVLSATSVALTLAAHWLYLPWVALPTTGTTLILILLTGILCAHLKHTHQKIQQGEDQLLKIKASETMFRGMTQSAPLGLFELDADDKFVFVNPAWEKITGHSLTRVLGKSWELLVDAKDHPKIFEAWNRHREGNKGFSESFQMTRPDGEKIWLHMRSKSLFHDRGQVRVCTLADVSQQKMDALKKESMIQELLELKKKLEINARTDPLTGINNRRGMHSHLNQEVSRDNRHEHSFSLLIADIDFFKAINDTHGHDGGDLVLKELATRLTDTCRAHDIVSRWGGEEFLILLPETDMEGAMIAGEKFRRSIEDQPFLHDGNPIAVTISVGVATFHPGSDLDACIRRADAALYQAKGQGRNRVVSSEAGPAIPPSVIPIRKSNS